MATCQDLVTAVNNVATNIGVLNSLLMVQMPIVSSSLQNINNKLGLTNIAIDDVGVDIDEIGTSIVAMNIILSILTYNMPAIADSLGDIDTKLSPAGNIGEDIHTIDSALTDKLNQIAKGLYSPAPEEIFLKKIFDEISGHCGNLDSLAGISSLPTIATNTGSIATETGSIAIEMGDAVTQLTSVVTWLSYIDVELTTIGNEIVTVYGQLNAISGTISTIATSIDAIDTSVSSLSTSLVSIDEYIEAIEGLITTMDESLSIIAKTDLEVEISGNTKKAFFRIKSQLIEEPE